MTYIRILYALVLISSLTMPLSAQQDSSYIVLARGEKINGKVEQKEPFLGTPYILFNDSTRYEMKDLRAYQNSDGYFAKLKTSWSPTFVKRTIKGKIDFFSRTQWFMFPGNMQTVTTPGGPMTIGAGPTVQTQTEEYFCKNGIDVLEADYGNLKDALADNPQSMAYLNEYHTLQTWQWSLAGGGLALVIAGLATMEKGSKKPPGLIFVGASVSFSAWIPYLLKSDKIQLAIKVYNK